MYLRAYKNHIVFVSAQNPPSFIPVLISSPKPESLRAVYTEQVSGNSDDLGRVCAQNNMRYIPYFLNKVDKSNIFQVLNAILHESSGESIILNITGGLKLMTIAAFEWANLNTIPVFYVDTNNQQIVHLDDDWHFEPLPNVLSVNDILGLYGYQIESCDDRVLHEVDRIAAEAILVLATTVEGKSAITTLNACAANAVNSLMSNNCGFGESWNKLLRICVDAGKLRLSGANIHFVDDAARRWCNGIWLEDYVKSILFRMRQNSSITDFKCSVKTLHGTVPNEADAMFTHQNRLYTIECKTVNYCDRYDVAKSNDRASTAIYKADSLLRKQGGVLAKGFLCSLFPLPEYEQHRADLLRINVISGSALLNLRNKLPHRKGG